MGQDSRPTLASKGCGQLHSLSLCKDRLASRRETPLGTAARSSDEWMAWVVQPHWPPVLRTPGPLGRWVGTEGRCGCRCRHGALPSERVLWC